MEKKLVIKLTESQIYTLRAVFADNASSNSSTGDIYITLTKALDEARSMKVGA